MRIALFDLDHTLLPGDSGYAWGQFLIDQGVLEREHFEARNREFARQYREGSLDIGEFLRFSLEPLARHPRHRLEAWRAGYVESRVRPMIPDAARALVDGHRDSGDLCLLVTATNRFVSAPIAAEFGIGHVLATEPEERDGEFTGDIAGLPCFREGKVRRIEDWLAGEGLPLSALDDAWFYSDSANDIPLLSRVGNPVAVDPDPALEAWAVARGAPVMWLHRADEAAEAAR